MEYNTWYILDKNKNPLPAKCFSDWKHWMNSNNKVIESSTIKNCEIITFFIGINQEISADKKPILFETIIFKRFPSKTISKIYRRYSDINEAKRWHGNIVKQYINKFKIKKIIGMEVLNFD